MGVLNLVLQRLHNTLVGELHDFWVLLGIYCMAPCSCPGVQRDCISSEEANSRSRYKINSYWQLCKCKTPPYCRDVPNFEFGLGFVKVWIFWWSSGSFGFRGVHSPKSANPYWNKKKLHFDMKLNEIYNILIRNCSYNTVRARVWAQQKVWVWLEFRFSLGSGLEHLICAFLLVNVTKHCILQLSFLMGYNEGLHYKFIIKG